jgi:hypothetical protein
MGRRKLERSRSLQNLADQVRYALTGKSTRCDLCNRAIRGKVVNWKNHSDGRRIPLCANAPDCIEGRR